MQRLQAIGYYILLLLGIAFALYMFGFVLLMIFGDLAYFIESWIR